MNKVFIPSSTIQQHKLKRIKIFFYNMGDYSRSQYCDNYEEAPDQNWKQEAMENAIRRYLSGPDSPLSPHPPYSPTPDDDPIHQHFFPTPNFQSMPLHYQRSFLDFRCMLDG